MGIPKARASQAGFSMIEMLMTAFIMAVGLLGLAMLQTMSLRASRGSKSLSAAVLVSERVMDQVELEGRLTWLNLTNNPDAPGTLADFPNSTLHYVTIPADGNLVESFNSAGSAVVPHSPNPELAQAFYTVTTTQAPLDAVAFGQLSDFTVQVLFQDNTEGNQRPHMRTVTMTRRVLHG